MRQIFIFTAGDKAARKNLDFSILQPVPFSLMEEVLGSEKTTYVQSLVPGQNGFYAWGAVPGTGNDRNWKLMQPGDLVLTVYEKQYHFLSSVIGKINNAQLSQRIWGTNPGGYTWQYMYFLTRPQPINAKLSDKPAIDYLCSKFQGYSRISDAKILKILDDYGSLDSFIKHAFEQTIPPTPAENAMEQVRSAADSCPPFAPKDLVDGRQKVFREVVRRQGQPKFRKQLLEAYDSRCAVTGCEVEAVLEAAHIAPYLGKESNTVQNGLLLRADIHTLFDLGQLKITTAGEIELDEKLLGSVYGELHGKQIRKPAIKAAAPSIAALELKFGLA